MKQEPKFQLDEDIMLDLALDIRNLVEMKLGFLEQNVDDDELLKLIFSGERFSFYCWSLEIVRKFDRLSPNVVKHEARGIVTQQEACAMAMSLLQLTRFGCKNFAELVPVAHEHFSGLAFVADQHCEYLAGVLDQSSQDVVFASQWLGRHVMLQALDFTKGLLIHQDGKSGLASLVRLDETLEQLKQSHAGCFTKEHISVEDHSVGVAYSFDLHSQSEGNALVKVKSGIARWNAGELRLGTLCLLLKRETNQLDFLEGAQWDAVHAIIANLWITAFGMKLSEKFEVDLSDEIKRSVRSDLSDYCRYC